MTLGDRIQAVERRLLGAERLLLTILVVGMTALGFLQIVLRRGFSGGFLWADTFLRHLVLWVAFLGAGVAAAQDKHFGADLGERFFAGHSRTVAQVVVHLFTVVVCGLLTRASFVFISAEFASARICLWRRVVPSPGTCAPSRDSTSSAPSWWLRPAS